MLSFSWTMNGQYIALGLFDGRVTIRNRAGVETAVIERSEPVWAVCWNSVLREDHLDVLAVGCWDKTLSFYQLNGSQLGTFVLCSRCSWIES